MKRVGYDAQAFLSANGGTGKGLQLRNLIAPFADQFLPFASNEPNRSGMQLIQAGRSGHTLWQELSLPNLLRQYRVEIFLAPYNVAPFLFPREIDLVLVLHDLIQLDMPSASNPTARLLNFYRRAQIPMAVKIARVVVTVSQYSREKILERFPMAHVHVIPCTIGREWFDQQSPARGDGHLLLVTGSAPHKNAVRGFKAYAEYARRAGSTAHPLWVVGLFHHGDIYRSILEQLGISHLVKILPFLTKEDLISTYRNAAALFLPSLSEGFGIPLLEAMASGTPVLAAFAGSIPEVAGGAARYFDPLNVEEMAQVLLETMGDEQALHSMSEKGLERASAYSPETVRRQVIDFWSDIAGLTPCCG